MRAVIEHLRWFGDRITEYKGGLITWESGNGIQSSAHAKFRYQYHIVFAPKYSRKVIYGQLKRDISLHLESSMAS